MRSHFLNYTAVGIFVSAMIIALVVLLSMLAGRTGPTDPYSIVLDDVTDVKYGTVVRFAGYPIGQVEEIAPEYIAGKYRFRLHIAVKDGWKFPSDSIARIAASSFLAGKTIEINGGQSQQVIAVGGEIAGGTAADMFSLMAQVAAEIGDLSQSSLKPLVARISDIIERIGNTTETNLQQLMGSLNSIAREVNSKTPTIMSKVDQILSDKNIGAIATSLDNIQKATTNAEVASRDLKALGSRITSVADEINAMVGDNRKEIDKSIADLEYILRAVAQNIDSITHNLDGTTRNMSEFSRLIRQNPGLLLSGSNPETDQGLQNSKGDEE